MARRIHLWLLAALLALAPIPLGSNRPWAWGLLAVGTGALAVMWGILLLGDRDSRPAPPALLPMALWTAALAWVALQMQSWLPVAPADLWRDTAMALGTAVPASPALNRPGAWDGLLRMVTYGLLFWLGLQHGTSPRRSIKLVTAVGATGVALALFGLSLRLLGIKGLFGLQKTAYADYLTATFVNPNSLACLLGLSLLCLGIAVRARRKRLGMSVAKLLARGDRWTGAGLAGIVLLGAALLDTGSRGGMLATASGGLVLFLLLHAGDRGRLEWLRGTGAPAVAGAAAVVLAIVLAALVSTGLDLVGDRQNVWRTAIVALGRSPVAGTGLGSFAGVFAALRPEEIGQFWSRAHNVYLELMVEMGIPAALCFFTAVLLLGARALETAADPTQSGVGALGAAATVLVAVHGLVDFAPQIPAVAATYAALLGLAAAAPVRPGRSIAGGQAVLDHGRRRSRSLASSRQNDGIARP